MQTVLPQFQHICLYLLFTLLLLSHVYDFTPMLFTVPMWGSEVANSKTEIHLTNTPCEMTWACDVTTTEREDDIYTCARVYDSYFEIDYHTVTVVVAIAVVVVLFDLHWK